MRTAKKWLAAVLSLLLVLSQAAWVLAEETQVPSIMDAVAAGREASYSVSFEWGQNPMLVPDAETNALIASIIDSLEFTGRYTTNEDNTEGYTVSAINLDGEEAMSLNTVYEDGDAYISSQMLGDPIAVPQDEMRGYVVNLGHYIDMKAEANGEELDVSFAEQYGAMYDSFLDRIEAYKDGMVTEMSGPVAEVYTADLTQAATDWIEKEMVPEKVEEDTGSIFGIKSSSADKYTLTREQVIELFELLTPLLMENDAYWDVVMNFYALQMSASDPELTVEELKAYGPEVSAAILENVQEIPEGSILYMYVCYDENGDHILSKLECVVPVSEKTVTSYDTDGKTGESTETTDLRVNMEWMPDGIPFYMEALVDELDGIKLTIEGKSDTPDAPKDEGFVAVMDILSYGDVQVEFVMETTDIVADEDGTRVWDGEILLAMLDPSGQATGLLLSAHQEDSYEGNEMSISLDASMEMLMGDMELPILSMQATIETGTPQGAPFEVDESFVHPGAMSEDEFMTYMDKTLTPSTMKAMMRFASMLPNEVYASIIESMQSSY